MRSFRSRWAEWMAWVGGLAALAGLAAGLYAPDARWRADAFRKPVQTLPLRDLEANGFGDNPHVHVTDYVCGEGAVLRWWTTGKQQQPKSDNDNSNYQGWIPLFPKPLAGDEPAAIAVLLQTSQQMTSAKGVKILSRRPKMEALASRGVGWHVSSEVQAELASQYPGTDFSSVVLLRQYEKRDREDADLFAIVLTVLALGGLFVAAPLSAYGTYLLWTRPKVPDLNLRKIRRKWS